MHKINSIYVYLDVTTTAEFGHKLDRFEPLDIFGVVKHVPHNCRLLVDLEGMT